MSSFTISSPKPVQLESREPGAQGWVVVCDAPCDRELPLANTYRIAYAKNGKSPGESFRLDASAGSVEITARPPSASSGSELVAFGVVLASVSVLGLALGISGATQTNSCAGENAGPYCGAGELVGKPVALISGITLLLGGALIAAGVSAKERAKAQTTQRPWSGREPTWVGPQAATPKKAVVVTPLSFAF